MASKFETFAALHVPGDPVVLYNIWDVGSALAVVRAGAKALATGSHPVADSVGTVKTHAHNAFAKLGIASRAQLAQLMRGAD